MEFYNKKTPMRLFVNKTTINIDHFFRGYWSGIKTYKKLEYVLEYYHNNIKRETWEKMTLSEKMTYQIMKEYKEDSTTKIFEGVVKIFGNSINSNINKLKNSL
jgi:hypothetical protein